MKAKDAIREYAVIAFTLLGVLFGMMIMTFIFGSLGASTSSAFPAGSFTVTNESQFSSAGEIVFANETGYTLIGTTHLNFTGLIVTEVIVDWNQSNGSILSIGGTPTGYNVTLDPANYTVSAAGVVTNATDYVFPNASITYLETIKTENELTADEVNNGSLQAISSYTAQADTQLNTVAIAIILVILIGVFLLFWQIFVGGKGKKSSGGAQFG